MGKVICENVNNCGNKCMHGIVHHRHTSECDAKNCLYGSYRCIPISDLSEWRELDATKPHEFPLDLIVDGKINNKKYEFFVRDNSDSGKYSWEYPCELSGIFICNEIPFLIKSFADERNNFRYCRYRVRPVPQEPPRPILSHEEVFSKWFKTTEYSTFKKIFTYEPLTKKYQLDCAHFSLDQLNAMEWCDVPPQGEDNE